MEHPYFLQTRRIGFSHWRPEDLPLARLLWGNPEVTRYICASGRFSETDIALRLETEVARQAQYRVQYWPIFSRSTQELIGCCGLRPHGNEAYEIGFHLLPAFWRQGYAVEAASAVIDYAFSVLHARQLFAGHHPLNAASKAVLAKLGFRYTGDTYYEPTGLLHPSYERKSC